MSDTEHSIANRKKKIWLKPKVRALPVDRTASGIAIGRLFEDQFYNNS